MLEPDVTIEILKRCAPVSQSKGLTEARKALRTLMKEAGLHDDIKISVFLTILDELGNNILRHGRQGSICIYAYKGRHRVGIRMVAEDKGSGIEDLEQVLAPGYSEDRGMGMGLNLLKALADDVRIASLLNGGTYVEVWKWI